MTARDAVRQAHRKLRPPTIHIVAGAPHPEPRACRGVEGEPVEGHPELPAAPPLDYARAPHPEPVEGPHPRDYAEPDEQLPAAARPMFDTLSWILLGSIVALALVALTLGFSLGGR